MDIVKSISKTSEDIVREAFSYITKYQSGEMLPASTGLGYVDIAMLGGLFPQNAMAIGARPAVGKSYVAQKIMRHVMDVTKNPQAIDYFWIRCEFEMPPVDLIVRSISAALKKDVAEVLTRMPNDMEKEIINRVLKEEMSDRVLYVPRPCTTNELRALLYDRVMPQCGGKKLVILSIDHIGLTLGGQNAKANIDDMVMMLNSAKLDFPNLFILVISQLNRDIEGRRDKKEHEPRLSDFYQSDTLGQLCSTMIALNNPRRYGYQTYMDFPQTWYPTLDRFKDTSKRSFLTDGLMFHHVVKTRQRRLEEIVPIHADIMPGWERRYADGGIVRIDTSVPMEGGKPINIIPISSTSSDKNDFDYEHDDTPY